MKTGLAREHSSRGHLGSGLLVVESALTLILVAGAGLTINTLIRLQTIDYGFETKNLWWTSLCLDQEHYPARLADRSIPGGTRRKTARVGAALFA